MEYVEHQTSSTDPLLECCLCRRLLQEAVQLTCLHNCCHQCFSTAASTGNSQQVACGSCDTVTQAGRERPNDFIDNQVRRHKLVAESRVCGKCKENGERNLPAVLWCPTCRHSLCDGCIALHRQYFKQHVTQSLDELRSMSEVFSLESPSVCQIHKKPVDIACRNCEQAKCITCWAECNEKKHEMHVFGKDSFDSYIGEFVTCISAMESELLRKSEVLQIPKILLRDTKVARDCHLEDLRSRKRIVIDAVEMVYHEIEFSIKNAYDNMEAQGEFEAAAADRIASDMSVALSYIHRLIESNDKCEILKQQKIVRERLSVLSAQLNTLSDRLATTVGEVKIEASLPENLELVLRAWIGIPCLLSASVSLPPPQQQYMQQQQQQPEQLQLQSAQQQSVSLGAASAIVQLPVECASVDLTTGGRSMLIAAQQHGLIEFCSSSGRELSRWVPPEHKLHNEGDGSNDKVLAVAALSDGRAAVSLVDAKLVVLLRRRKQGEGSCDGAASAAGDAWTVDRRLCELVCSPGLLSAHGVVLAVQLGMQYGTLLRLINSSSGQLFSADLQCQYHIGSLAVAERVIVVGGIKNREWISSLEACRMVYVLDAHNLAYGQRLWRHELISNCGDRKEEWEDLHGVCADSTGGFLYAAVSRNDWSSGRVSELSLSDGSELQRFALSFDQTATPKQLSMPPWWLSLSEDSTGAAQQQQLSNSSSSRTVSSGRRRALLLAVLCRDSASKLGKIVTLHRIFRG